MPRIDLVTGFLGSGKTTFIKKYAQYLIDSGLNIGILENDYGAVNVDMMLLRDLPEDKCELEMVAGGCDLDCHRRRFRTKLIAMGMAGYDVVIVEPSGIYDVDEFFDALAEEPLDRWYRIGNVIAIADAQLDDDLSGESEYLLASQLVNAGCIVLSRTQEAPEEQVRSTVSRLKALPQKFRARRDRPLTDADILAKDWSDLSSEDFERIASSGYVKGDHIKQMVDRDNAYSSQYYMDLALKEDQLMAVVTELFAHPEEYGKVIRVKGFVRRCDGNTDKEGTSLSSEMPAFTDSSWLEINATRHGLHTEPLPEGQDVVIVIGEHLNKDAVNSCIYRACSRLKG